MKKLQLTLRLLAFSTLFTFSACQKEESLDPAVEIDFTSAEFQLEDIDAIENTTVIGGATANAFSVTDADAREKGRFSFSDILSKLNLNDRQKLAIKGFVEEHEKCASEHRIKVQEIHKDLLKRADAVRTKYLEEYKAGTITKEVLDKKLLDLRTKLREEIMTNEARKVHLQALRKCRAVLVTKIESVLSPVQLQIWKLWKQSR